MIQQNQKFHWISNYSQNYSGHTKPCDCNHKSDANHRDNSGLYQPICYCHTPSDCRLLACGLVSTLFLPEAVGWCRRTRPLMRPVQVPVIYVVDMSETPRARTATPCKPIATVASAMRVYKIRPLGLSPAENPTIAKSERIRTSMFKAFVIAIDHIFGGTGNRIHNSGT